MRRVRWAFQVVAIGLVTGSGNAGAAPGDAVDPSSLQGPVFALPVKPSVTARARPGDDIVAAYLRGLQQALPNHGYRPGPVTGRLDPATAQAILAYQRDARIARGTHDAAVLQATLDHVLFVNPPVVASPGTMSPPSAIRQAAPAQPPPQAIPSGPPATFSPPSAVAAPEKPVDAPPSPPSANEADIRFVQEKLKAQGYDIAVSGELDHATANAIKAYQGSSGLARTGSIDQPLLDHLRQ